MTPTSPPILAQKARLAGFAIAGTMLGWMLMQQIGAEYGWPLKYTLLIDLFALAGFIWALAVVFQIWRARRAERASQSRAERASQSRATDRA